MTSFGQAVHRGTVVFDFAFPVTKDKHASIMMLSTVLKVIKMKNSSCLSQVLFRLPRFHAGMSLTVLESSTTGICSTHWKTMATRDTSAVNTSR